MMLNAAVIGLGVGAQHAKALAVLPDCRVAWLCDLDAGRLATVGADHPGAALTENAGEVLADPDLDLVVIASYDNHHAEQAVTALDRGLHVFQEKPICQTEAELDRIVAALKRHPELVFQANLILRRTPRLSALKAVIEGGEFGEIYYAEADYAYGRVQKITEGWRGSQPYYSVMAGGGIHMIDMLLWLTGRRVEEVQGYGNRIATRDTAFRFDDLSVALLRMEDGMIAKVSANFACVHPHSHLFAIYGTRKTFVQNVLGAAFVTSRDPAVAPELLPADSFTPKGAYIARFIDAIRTGTPPEISSEEIVHAMRVSLAIDQAIAEHRMVALPRSEF